MADEKVPVDPDDVGRTGPRKGGSRTYDKDGNLIEVDGVPVNAPAKKKTRSARTEGGD